MDTELNTKIKMLQDKIDKALEEQKVKIETLEKRIEKNKEKL